MRYSTSRLAVVLVVLCATAAEGRSWSKQIAIGDPYRGFGIFREMAQTPNGDTLVAATATTGPRPPLGARSPSTQSQRPRSDAQPVAGCQNTGLFLSIFISKVSSAGSVLWLRNYFASPCLAGHQMIATPDGGAAILASMTHTDETTHTVVFRIDGNGEVLWSTSLRRPVGDLAPISLSALPDDRFLVAVLFGIVTLGADGSTERVDAFTWNDPFNGTVPVQIVAATSTSSGGWLASTTRGLARSEEGAVVWARDMPRLQTIHANTDGTFTAIDPFDVIYRITEDGTIEWGIQAGHGPERTKTDPDGNYWSVRDELLSSGSPPIDVLTTAGVFEALELTPASSEVSPLSLADTIDVQGSTITMSHWRNGAIFLRRFERNTSSCLVESAVAPNTRFDRDTFPRVTTTMDPASVTLLVSPMPLTATCFAIS